MEPSRCCFLNFNGLSSFRYWHWNFPGSLVLSSSLCVTEIDGFQSFFFLPFKGTWLSHIAAFPGRQKSQRAQWGQRPRVLAPLRPAPGKRRTIGPAPSLPSCLATRAWCTGATLYGHPGFEGRLFRKLNVGNLWRLSSSCVF